MQQKQKKTDSLADRAEASILREIRDAGYRPGDRLPGEKEFAERLGISRNMVREALSRLRMLGVLESRRKRGMVLREPDFLGGIRRILLPDLIGHESARELFELRLVIETGMTDLVCRRRTPEALAELETAVGQWEAALTREERVQSDIAFHAVLYRMSGNRLLSEFQELLRAFFREAVRRESDPPPDPVPHRQLLEVLRDGTAADFREAMRNHLEPHFTKLASWPESGEAEKTGENE